jgi:hypothetical protein
MNISVLGVDAPLKNRMLQPKALGGRNVASNPEGKNGAAAVKSLVNTKITGKWMLIIPKVV